MLNLFQHLIITASELFLGARAGFTLQSPQEKTAEDFRYNPWR